MDENSATTTPTVVPQQWLPVAEAAAVTGVPERTIFRWIKAKTNAPETAALEAFLADFNRSRLRHPGDPFARPILFELQIR